MTRHGHILITFIHGAVCAQQTETVMLPQISQQIRIRFQNHFWWNSYFSFMFEQFPWPCIHERQKHTAISGDFSRIVVMVTQCKQQRWAWGRQSEDKQLTPRLYTELNWSDICDAGTQCLRSDGRNLYQPELITSHTHSHFLCVCREKKQGVSTSQNMSQWSTFTAVLRSSLQFWYFPTVFFAYLKLSTFPLSHLSNRWS